MQIGSLACQRIKVKSRFPAAAPADWCSSMSAASTCYTAFISEEGDYRYYTRYKCKVVEVRQFHVNHYKPGTKTNRPFYDKVTICFPDH